MDSTRVVCLLLMVLLSQLSVNAQTTKGAQVENITPVVTGNQYAVVVGISKYKHLPSLQFADADARYFADFLIRCAGVKPENVRLFLNDSATLSILSELNKIKKKVTTGDRVYIYFSGHGDIETEMEQGGLLLLHESNAESYYLNPNGYIQESQLKAAINQLTNSGAEVIFIADACHSGKLSGGDEGRKNNLLALKQAWGKEVKIFSCQPTELSLEGEQWGKGRGLFSYHLINGLLGAADTTDTPDSKVSLFELQTFLQSNVRREAKPNKQTPFVTGNLDMIVCNTGNNAATTGGPLLAGSFAGGTKGKMPETSADVSNLYNQFNEAVKSNKLTGSGNTALGYLQQLKDKNAPELILENATRSLVAALLNQSTVVINPLLTGSDLVIDKTTLTGLISGLDKVMELLGTDHYLYPAFESRRLFMQGISLTLTEEDVAKKENVTQAIKLFEQSVQKEPYAYYSYFYLGVNYYRKKLPEKAIEYFNKYKSYLPKDADTYNNIGLAYYKLNNLPEAVKYIGQAVGIQPNNYIYYFNMGNVMCSAGDLPKGVYAYRRALELKPMEPNVLFNMATAFSYAGFHDSAVVYYKLALQKNSNDGKAWQYLGNTQMKMKKYNDALDSYNRAVNAGNNAFRIYYNQACIFSLKGDTDKGLAAFEESLKRGMSDFVMEVYNDPALANLRNTAQFTKLMKKYAAK